jgi:hypothetical protein
VVALAFGDLTLHRVEAATTDDARVRVGARVVRIDRASTLCSGEGASRRRSGVRRWRHFLCTYTTSTPRGVGCDLEFRVHVLGCGAS